jgi:chromosome segregation ATPase
MNLPSRKPVDWSKTSIEAAGDASAQPALQEAGADVAADFSYRVAAAENVNLKERIGRLEASIAFWAADVDEANEEAQRLRTEVESLRVQARTAEDAKLAAEAERARLYEAVNLRDAHIGELEARIVTHDMDDVATRRTRSRLVAIRKRVRARMAAQSEELASLRRMLALGHAARRQTEDELAGMRMDGERNARYLDKLERRLEEAEARLAEQPKQS